MIKSTAAIQTMLICLLPLLVNGFNSSLSFEPIGLSAGKVNQVKALTEAPYRIKTIVIDAGHGGKDPGCSGPHSREKHIALAVSLQLAKTIRAKFPDIRVILTRDKDVFIPLYERAAIANRANADLFISIHCNFLPGSAATRGTETYVMGLHTAEHNLNVAKRENAAILLEEDYEKNYDYDPNSPEGHIMMSMFQNAHLEQSILLAEKFEAHAAKTANRRSRGVKQAGFVVLKETTMPSILAEIGFLSNSREEGFLKSTGGQAKMVNALTLAFAEYKQVIENEAFTVGAGNNPIASIPIDGKQINRQPQASSEPFIRVEKAPAPQTAATQAPVRYPSPSSPSSNTPININQAPPTPIKKQVIIRSHYDNGADVTPVRVNQSVPASHPPAQTRVIPLQESPVTSRPVTTSEPQITPRSVQPTSVEAIIDNGDLLFCVQLAASPKPLNTQHERWTQVGYPIEVVVEDKYYKYQVRRFSTLNQANKAKSSLQHRGFIDAFVAIYRNGKRVSQAEAKRILGL